MYPGRIVLSASSPDRPSPVAPPCAPFRPARGMFGFWTRQVKKVYKDNYVGTGTLVSSQERRALAVSGVNPGSTAGFVPPSVYIGFSLLVLTKKSL